MVTWLLRCYIKPNWQGADVVSFGDCLERMAQEIPFSLKMRHLGSVSLPSAISSITLEVYT